MVKISGTYEGDLHCQATHGPSGATLATDAPVDNQGKGEAFSPTDLAATALATCMATIMGIKAQDLGIDLSGMRFEVTKEMAPKPPRRLGRLTVTFAMPATFDEPTRIKLQRAAEGCPVHHSLHPDVQVEVDYQWPDAS